MQFSGSPVICGTYSYGNTFDFRTRIVGATDPFSYSGFIYNSEGTGIQNIPIKFYSKLKSSSTYTLESTINTDATGKYTISSTKDATLYDFQIEISSLTILSPISSDAQFFNTKVLSQSFVSKDYYRDELRYQDKIDGFRNAASMDAVNMLIDSLGNLQIRFPDQMRGKTMEGDLWLYCKTDAAKDLRVPLLADTATLRVINVAGRASGKYLAKLHWAALQVPYEYEQEIIIP
jgi:hypothetical protein